MILYCKPGENLFLFQKWNKIKQWNTCHLLWQGFTTLSPCSVSAMWLSVTKHDSINNELVSSLHLVLECQEALHILEQPARRGRGSAVRQTWESSHKAYKSMPHFIPSIIISLQTAFGSCTLTEGMSDDCNKLVNYGNSLMTALCTELKLFLSNPYWKYTHSRICAGRVWLIWKKKIVVSV